MDQKETERAPREVVEPENKEEHPAPKREKRPEKIVPEIEVLRGEIAGMDKVDKKIRHVLSFMRGALSGEKEAKLGLFWKGRTECMTLFKENMLQATRSVLWSEYLELIQEARRVKEILDEASSFAIEQIEIAINALEENLQNLPELLQKSKAVSLPSFADKGCLSHRDLYLSVQKELVLLNAYASRVQALRKEVIQTGMRLKIKNRFFVRLSAAGDLIFPKRRELIKTLSDAFVEDVERFVDAYFKAMTKEAPNYVLREEIKNFQELAKRLTLNTASFSKTRKELSGAWDVLKERDKERKKELGQKRELFKQNYDSVMEKITPFAEKCGIEGAEKATLENEGQEILDYMLTVDLAREDVRRLKDEIAKAQSPLFEKERAFAEEKKRLRLEQEEKRKEGAHAFIKQVAILDEGGSDLSYEEIKETAAKLTGAQAEHSLNAAETVEVKTHFARIKALLSQKYEEVVFGKEGQPEFLEELKALLEQKQSERFASKKQLEIYRRQIGGSGLDFEQAMKLRDLNEEEKKRLEYIDATIEKIEEKLA